MSRTAQAAAEAREVVARLELDCLVCLFDGVHSFLEPNPVYDLTGFRSIDESAAVVDADGVTLVAAPAWDAERARERAGDGVRVVACDDVAGQLAAVLTGRRRVGAVGLPEVSRRLGDALGGVASEIVPADAEVVGRQRPKSSDELERARRAAAIAEQAYATLLAGLRPGVAEYELVARLDAEVARLGAEDDFVLMSSGRAGRPVRAPGARKLEPGDVLNAEISPCCAGQFAQICRTVVLGRATAQQRRDHELLTTALAAGMAAATPGTSVGAVVEAMDRPIVEAGHGEYCRPPHIRVRGHGQGVASISPGDIVHDNDVVLQEGMMFVLHPNQPVPPSGYLMCGEPVVITPAGARALTTRPPQLYETGER